MITEKKFGKIKSINYGYCGYQDVQIGLSIDLGGDGWGVRADKPGAWGTERTSSCKWTEADRIKALGENVMYMKKLLDDAKVQQVDQLKNKPVECTFEGNTLKEWRILTEVL